MDRWFTEFGYPSLGVPCGVIEVGMPQEAEQMIHEMADMVAGRRSEYTLTRQCIEMAPAWCHALQRGLDLPVSLRGGRGGEEQARGPGHIGPDRGG